MKKRLLCVLLCLAMLLSMLPMAAFAEEAEPETEELIAEEETAPAEPEEIPEEIPEEEVPTEEETVEEILPEEEPLPEETPIEEEILLEEEVLTDEEPAAEEEILPEDEMLPEETEEEPVETEVLFEEAADATVITALNVTVEPATYTGKAIKFPVTVTCGGELLTAGKDYTVSYKNNTNAAGPDAAKAPTVTVTGRGKYSGKVVVKTEIFKADLGDAELAKALIVKRTGKVIKPKVSLKYAGKTVSTAEYTIEYPDEAEGAYKENGYWTVLVQAKGKNFEGSYETTLRIAQGLITGAKITLAKTTVPYQKNGMTENPAIKKVTIGKTVLEEGKDFAVSYEPVTGAGKGKVTIEGLGDYADTGTKSASYKVTAVKLTDKMIMLEHGGAKLFDHKTWMPQPGEDFTVVYGDKMLVEHEDYEWVFASGNNYNAGKFTVAFKGLGEYTGTVKKSFAIKKRPVTDETITIEAPEEVAYVKGGLNSKTPFETVKMAGITMHRGRDYTVTFKNTAKMGTGYMYITGKGNYSGNTKATPIYFTITGPKAVEQYFRVTEIADVPFKNEYKNYEVKPEIRDSVSGKVLAEGLEYDVVYEVLDPVTKKYTAPGSKVGIDMAGEDRRIVIRMTITGKGIYVGQMTAEYGMIVAARAAMDYFKVLGIESKPYPYTEGVGNYKLDITVYDSKEYVDNTPDHRLYLREGKDYELTYEVKNPGTGKYEAAGESVGTEFARSDGRIDMRVTITGKGVYYDQTKSVLFNRITQTYQLQLNG